MTEIEVGGTWEWEFNLHDFLLAAALWRLIVLNQSGSPPILRRRRLKVMSQSQMAASLPRCVNGHRTPQV